MSTAITDSKLETYREEMRGEFKRNVETLNSLLVQTLGDEKENVLGCRAEIAPENPLKCNLITRSDEIGRSLGPEAVLKKIRTLESKLRLKHFYSKRGVVIPHSQPSSINPQRRLIDEIRQLNTETVKLINKLKYQIDCI